MFAAMTICCAVLIKSPPYKINGDKAMTEQMAPKNIINRLRMPNLRIFFFFAWRKKTPRFQSTHRGSLLFLPAINLFLHRASACWNHLLAVLRASTRRALPTSSHHYCWPLAGPTLQLIDLRSAFTLHSTDNLPHFVHVLRMLVPFVRQCCFSNLYCLN